VFVATNMKLAAALLLVSFALLSQALAVLRPLFPIKPAPPLGDQLIVIEDNVVRSSAKEPTQRFRPAAP